MGHSLGRVLRLRTMHDGIDQGLLSRHELLHPFAGEVRDGNEREGRDHIHKPSGRPYAGVHLLPGHVDQLLLCIDEGVGSFFSQLSDLRCLHLLHRLFTAGGFRGFFDDHIQELLLGVDEVIHRVARQLHQVGGVEWLSRLDGRQPVVGLLARQLQDILV